MKGNISPSGRSLRRGRYVDSADTNPDGYGQFNIVGHPYQFAAYFVENWTNFLEPRVNPPFVGGSLGGTTISPCFDTRLDARDLGQLQLWQRSGVPTNLQTNQIHYLERQRQNLQRLVEYWDAQFVMLVPSYVGPINTGSASGGAAMGPGFRTNPEFLKYRHVMTRQGGSPPPQLVLAGNLPPRYQSLRNGTWSLHRTELRP